MRTIKGPAIFLAQFCGDEKPFNNLKDIGKWANSLGYKAVQIPTWDKRIFDLDKAGSSKDYCDEVKGILEEQGLEISELSTHLQGQLVASHPAYDLMFDVFAPENLHGNVKERTKWAVEQMNNAINASNHLGISPMASFSGALLFHTFYPWPQRPTGLVEEGFKELAKRWKPILDHADSKGVDICYEIHPGEDLHDGVTFERFLKETGNHKRANILYDPSHFVLQQLDYLEYIDHYHSFIKSFHVKDSEFNPTGKKGAFGGYGDWIDRAGRYRSLGDGQIDFKSIFTKLTEYGCDVWAVMEWECCIKSPEQGAREGAPFIQSNIIEATQKTFDDFAGSEIDENHLKKILNL